MKTVAASVCAALLPLVATIFGAVACVEDTHEHDAEEFTSYDECVAHYTDEGRGPEAAELCADLAEGE